MQRTSRRLSLQKRIVMMFLIAIVIMLSLLMLLDTISLNKTVKQAYVSQINGMTIAINGRYEESRSVNDVQQIFDYIGYKNEHVLDLKLYNKEGLIQASSHRYEIGMTLPKELVRFPELDRTIVEHLPKNAAGTPRVRLIAPLQEDGDVVGAVEVIFDSTEEAELVATRVTFIMGVGIAITILLLVLLWLITRQIVIIPLMRLREAANVVKHGGNLPKLQFKASPEIEEVSDAFNGMVENLDARYHELQTALDTLQRTQAQLVQSEKMSALGSLVAGVAHEINTPLGIGVTAVSYLEMKTKEFQDVYQSGKMKRSDLEQYLASLNETTEMVQANLQRASELVRSFKQISADQSIEEKRTFRLNEYLCRIMLSLKPTLKKTRLHLRINCDPNLTLYSLPGVLSQIITNLVMNSMHHAYEPGEDGHLVIDVNDGRDRIQICYSDDGKGMKQEVLEHIFDPFFTTKRGRGGTGLGMHIVYNLVTQSLGGTISCSSVPGRGTLFQIEIPNTKEPMQ